MPVSSPKTARKPLFSTTATSRPTRHRSRAVSASVCPVRGCLGFRSDKQGIRCV
ncbi:MAG: hypothetical protein MZV64_36985 [Ignavibacteriales bacterium]|nr:hypothetical protein [Ignavibacteriales bacterium]